MVDTSPVFVVSSGRSGTAMLNLLFSGRSEVESHHEYLCTHVQKISCLYAMKIIGYDEARNQLSEIYSPALRYSRKPIFVDSSNKLSWVTNILGDLYENARFIHLVRDGRKVVSSYYNKLSDECYDSQSVNVLYKAINEGLPLPPPEKRYYWPHPVADERSWQKFVTMTQFERICWHWNEVNLTIESHLDKLSPRSIFFRLEDLTTCDDKVKELADFVGIGFRKDMSELFKRPHNVNVPIDRPLSDLQKSIFFDLSHDLMEKYGYLNSEEYEMHYENRPKT